MKKTVLRAADAYKRRSRLIGRHLDIGAGLAKILSIEREKATGRLLIETAMGLARKYPDTPILLA